MDWPPLLHGIQDAREISIDGRSDETIFNGNYGEPWGPKHAAIAGNGDDVEKAVPEKTLVALSMVSASATRAGHDWAREPVLTLI